MLCLKLCKNKMKHFILAPCNRIMDTFSLRVALLVISLSLNRLAENYPEKLKRSEALHFVRFKKFIILNKTY